MKCKNRQTFIYLLVYGSLTAFEICMYIKIVKVYWSHTILYIYTCNMLTL